jgi:hypothetical protein
VSINRLSIALLGCIAASAQAAGAQEVAPAKHDASSPRHGTMSYDGSYVMLGPSFSVLLDRGDDASFALGAEVSAVNVSDAFWVGAYVDAAHAFSLDETRLSLGPELGVRFLGLDGGYLASFGREPSPQHGVTVRPMLTFGVVTAYFRSSWLLGAHADWLGELGVLLKVPIVIDNEPWF